MSKKNKKFKKKLRAQIFEELSQKEERKEVTPIIQPQPSKISEPAQTAPLPQQTPPEIKKGAILEAPTPKENSEQKIIISQLKQIAIYTAVVLVILTAATLISKKANYLQSFSEKIYNFLKLG